MKIYFVTQVGNTGMDDPLTKAGAKNRLTSYWELRGQEGSKGFPKDKLKDYVTNGAVKRNENVLRRS